MTKVQKLMLAACAGLGLLAGGVTMAANSNGSDSGGSDSGGGDFGGGFAQGGGYGFAGWRHHDGSGEGRGFAELHMLGRVGLSDSQKATIIGLLKADRPKLQAIREEERAARKALAQVQPDDANYSAALNDAASKIADAARQQVELTGQLRQSVDNVLTADQKTKLATLRTQAEYRRVFGGDGQMGRGGWRGGQRGDAGSTPGNGQAQTSQ